MMVAAVATRTHWVVDRRHSVVEFSVKHLRFATVKGRFTAFSGTVTTDGDDPTRGEVVVAIEAGSVDTREPARDGHLRSNDFFGAAAHPTITFRSTGVEPMAGDGFRVSGDLTMKGVTRPIVLDAAWNGSGPNEHGQIVASWSATTEIVREEWGVSFNAALEAGGVLVGSRVKIALEIEAVRQEDEPDGAVPGGFGR